MRFIQRLFIKKSITKTLSQVEHTHQLERSLGPWQLIGIGVGAIVGAGIFTLFGKGASDFAGPAVALSFLFSGLICLFAALCYAEFSSLIPSSGSAYSYAYHTIGELPAWILGWCLTLEYLFGAATVASGWTAYVKSLCGDLGCAIPHKWSNAPLYYDMVKGWEPSGSYFNVPGALVIAFVSLLIMRGVRLATYLNDILVFLKLGAIALFVVVGIQFINGDNWVPFIPENTGVFGEFGFSGIFRGAGFIFFSYVGFDMVSTMGQDTKDPQRNLPIGMLGSLGVSTIAFIAVSLVATGVLSYTKLNSASPINSVIQTFGPTYRWLGLVIDLAIIAGLTSGMLVMLLGQSRIVYAMATDCLIPHSLGHVSKRFRTPIVASAVVGLGALLLAGCLPIEMLTMLAAIGTLLAFAIVCIAVMILRKTNPHLERPFRTPLVPFVPLVGALVCFVQMAVMPGVVWLEFFLWILVGLLIYFGYGRWHSKLRKDNR